MPSFNAAPPESLKIMASIPDAFPEWNSVVEKEHKPVLLIIHCCVQTMQSPCRDVNLIRAAAWRAANKFNKLWSDVFVLVDQTPNVLVWF